MNNHIATLQVMRRAALACGRDHKAAALDAAIAALEREQQAEPVAYQLRPKGNDNAEWMPATKREFDDRREQFPGYPDDEWDRRKLYAAPQQAGVPEAVQAHIDWCHTAMREHGLCRDGGKCHHRCHPAGECSRENGCVPLTGSRLTDKWELPVLAAPPPPAEARPVVDDVLAKYVAARDAYEAATRPPNSHARAPVLKHGDPVMVRYREARAALTAALARIAPTTGKGGGK